MKKPIFVIKHKDKKTKARVGLLMTKKGAIETPFFMPVATKASVKHLSSEEIEELGAKAVISNTFILYLKPGEKLIKEFGGVGKFMNFNGVNATDSGGFQMYSESLFLSATDKGVIFKNPFTGEKVFISPEKDMEVQIDLDSDIAMCLDSMPLIEKTKEEVAEAVRKTTLWAKRCKLYHDKLQSKVKGGKRQLLFGICQGGIHEDLRQRSAKELVELDFDGYSIGGLALGESREQEMKAVEIQKNIIPESKPVYLMGEGNPIGMLEAISRGVDMFDSRFPTQNARRGTLFTSEGKIRIFNKKFERDKNPIDKKCGCWVCKSYSRAYVRYQLAQEEGFGFRLATYHNLYFLQDLIKKAKEAIKKGKFLEFKKRFEKEWKKGEVTKD